MKIRRRGAVWFVLAAGFFLPNPSYAQGNITDTAIIRTDSIPSTRYADSADVISEGEDLLYEVSWLVFKLGTVRLKMLKTTVDSTHTEYSAAAFIDSYEGIPFVDLHAITFTTMDTALGSRRGGTVEKKGDSWWGLQYTRDSTDTLLLVEETWQKDLLSAPYKRTELDKIRLPQRFLQDGISLLYFARAHAHSQGPLTVPVVGYGKIGAACFEFTNKKGTEEINGVDQPIRVVECEGTLDLEGVLGLTGDFKGSFSDDSACIPIKARLKVLLGSVNLELKEWNRKSWSPPH